MFTLLDLEGVVCAPVVQVMAETCHQQCQTLCVKQKSSVIWNYIIQIPLKEKNEKHYDPLPFASDPIQPPISEAPMFRHMDR